MVKKIKLSQCIADWCDTNSPKTKAENMVVQYGLQLFISSLIKMLLLLIAGTCLHRFYETVIVLAVFCTLRLEAGGKHAKTEIGCTIFMVGVWSFSLWGGNNLLVSAKMLAVLFVILSVAIIKFAPKSVNSDLLSEKMKWKKRIMALILLGSYFIIAFFSHDMRAYFVWPAVIEVLSLLPIFRDKGGEKI